MSESSFMLIAIAAALLLWVMSGPNYGRCHDGWCPHYIIRD
jgi:hypothetical protein